MSVLVAGMDGHAGDLSCQDSWAHRFNPASLPLLRQARRLVICVSTASPCPSAPHVSILRVEAILLDFKEKSDPGKDSGKSPRLASSPKLGRVQDYLRAVPC